MIWLGDCCWQRFHSAHSFQCPQGRCENFVFVYLVKIMGRTWRDWLMVTLEGEAESVCSSVYKRQPWVSQSWWICMLACEKICIYLHACVGVYIYYVRNPYVYYQRFRSVSERATRLHFAQTPLRFGCRLGYKALSTNIIKVEETTWR